MQLRLPARVAVLARWASFAALGPITGPLVAGFLRHRKAAPILAILYLAAIPCAWLELTATLGLLKGVLVHEALATAPHLLG